jgi:hypothetical protein
MKNPNKIGSLINYLQRNSEVGWGVVHISWFSDGEFQESWKVNIDNKIFKETELYDALMKAKELLTP